jgi:hypothetical protein
MTELINQITHISKEIEETYGDYYSNQFEYAINDIKTKADINSTHIIVDIIDLTMNDDNKQKQINSLKKDVNILKQENKILKEDSLKKDIRINVIEKENNLLKIEIKELKENNKLLKEDNNNLKKRINVLETNKNIFDALVKLHECNALVNKEFKKLYKKKFNLSKYDNNVPNIGDFIENPPTEEDGDDYDFWIEFNNLYPGSDNENFRKIYKQIANNRADAGAHISVNKLSEYEFDKLIELVYPAEYNENKKIYNEYRQWLFMFPV